MRETNESPPHKEVSKEMNFFNDFKATMAKKHPETVKARPEPHQPLDSPPKSESEPEPIP